MEHGNFLASVKAQYEHYPYPPRDPEEERRRLRISLLDALDVVNHHGFGGRRDLSRGFRVLVAGGGTGDAAISMAEQLRGLGGEVIYLDMSGASMAVARARAAVRGLDNITWIQESLLELPRLGLGCFDYINCAGVLHHLEDPEAGLAALEAVLAEDGVIGLMVYAAYGRAPVYQVQALLAMLRESGDDMARQVEDALAVVEALPAHHGLKLSWEIYAGDLQAGPGGVYDLLLHSRDRAYTVPQLYDFVASAGLQITTLLSDEGYANLAYDPATYLRNPRLLARLRRLPLPSRQAAAELLHGRLCKHSCLVTRHPVAPPDLQDVEHMVPTLALVYERSAYGELARRCREAGEVLEVTVSRRPPLKVRLDRPPHLAALLEHMDGNRTLGEMIAAARHDLGGAGPDAAALLEEFRPYYEAMQLSNGLLLRHRDTPPLPTRGEMQARLEGGE